MTIYYHKAKFGIGEAAAGVVVGGGLGYALTKNKDDKKKVLKNAGTGAALGLLAGIDSNYSPSSSSRPVPAPSSPSPSPGKNPASAPDIDLDARKARYEYYKQQAESVRKAAEEAKKRQAASGNPRRSAVREKARSLRNLEEKLKAAVVNGDGSQASSLYSQLNGTLTDSAEDRELKRKYAMLYHPDRLKQKYPNIRL